MSKKKKKKKFNNPYKIDNTLADEIRNIPNDGIIERAASEYRNWMASEEQKKSDPEVVAVAAALKDIYEEIKSDPEYVKAKEEFDSVVESLVSEELERRKEELKNLKEPYLEDIKRFRGCFRLAMDEITERKQKGLMK